MQIAKKQLLGFGGLALVVAMTAFATTLPTGAVSSAGGDVDLYVYVYNVNFETIISSPLDGEVYSKPTIDFSEIHSHAYVVDYVLQLLDSNGQVAKSWDLTDYRVEGEDVNGTTEFQLNLDDYGGTGVYVFRSKITSSAGTTKEDAVQFTYAAIDADQDDVKTTSTKTSFRVSYTSGIKSITYQLRDSKGNPLTETFVANTTSPATGGYLDLSIDLSKLDLATGDYTIYIVGYDDLDAGGDLIDTATVKVSYVAPEAPKVPDTGSLLNALNISRADYLITGVIGFVVISIFALIAIKRAKKN